MFTKNVPSQERMNELVTPGPHQVIFDCVGVDDSILHWLAENNPNPPKPLHFMAGSKDCARIFFSKSDQELGLIFQIKFNDKIIKSNLDRFIDPTERVSLWLRVGDLQMRGKI